MIKGPTQIKWEYCIGGRRICTESAELHPYKVAMIHVVCLENILVLDFRSTSAGQMSDIACHYIFSTVKTQFLNVDFSMQGQGRLSSLRPWI